MDDFGYSAIWNDEHSKWLRVAERHGQLKSYLTRLKKCNEKERQETFAELAAAYVLEEIIGLPIARWAPNGGRGEFLIDLGTKQAFCEVKSPGWEAEIATQAGGKPPQDRLRQPKHISGQAFGFSTHDIIQKVMKKTREKFPNGLLGLLIFADDFRVSLIDDPLDVCLALYRMPLPPPNVDPLQPGYFLDSESSWLTGAVFLDYRLLLASNAIEYRFRCCPNDNAQHVGMVKKSFGCWIEQDFPETASWGRGSLPSHPLLPGSKA